MGWDRLSLCGWHTSEGETEKWARRHWPKTGKEEQDGDGGGDGKRYPTRVNVAVGVVVDVEGVAFAVKRHTEWRISLLLQATRLVRRQEICGDLHRLHGRCLHWQLLPEQLFGRQFLRQ